MSDADIAPPLEVKPTPICFDRSSGLYAVGFTVSENELRVSASRSRRRNSVERTRWSGRKRTGSNFNVLGTDPAIWKFQVPGFLRPQSLTEWPNCHKSNSKL